MSVSPDQFHKSTFLILGRYHALLVSIALLYRVRYFFINTKFLLFHTSLVIPQARLVMACHPDFFNSHNGHSRSLQAVEWPGPVLQEKNRPKIRPHNPSIPRSHWKAVLFPPRALYKAIFLLSSLPLPAQAEAATPLGSSFSINHLCEVCCAVWQGIPCSWLPGFLFFQNCEACK